MKKKISILLCIVLTFLCGCSASGNNIRFGAADIGGMYYSFASTFSELAAKQNEDYKFEVKSTAGSAANLRLLGDNYIELCIVQADLVDDAIADYDNIRAIAALYTEACQIVVRADSDINSLSDLQGKTISIGASESGTELNAKEILKFSGLTDELVTTRNLDYTEAAKELTDGRIDAMFCTAGIKTTVIDEISRECDIRLLSVDDACMNKLLGSSSYYEKYTIPANTYSGQDSPVNTIGVKSILLASSGLSDSVVEDITRTLFTDAKELQYSSSLNLELTEDNATDNINIPFHKGAADYYSSKGITVKTD